MSDFDQFTTELERIAAKPKATPTIVREAGRKLLNGALTHHPLIVHSGHKGPAMRFETTEGVKWVKVPENWLQIER